MDETFTVLHVCTGNLCRSPMAEHLMRSGLHARLGRDADAFTVGSAGTMGRTGERMEPYAHEALAERGVDGADFRVRELAAAQVVGADLVLTATRQHRVAVVELDPSAATRTFTLREFARLAELVDPGELVDGPPPVRAQDVVRALASRRRPASRPKDDDLADPYKGPLRGFQGCAAVIDDALRLPLDLLAGIGR